MFANFGKTIKLAWRNLWRSRRRTIITMSTIAFGFGLAVISIGLGDGGHNGMIRNAIRMGDGHLTIQARGYLEAPSNSLYLPDGLSLTRTLSGSKIRGRVVPRITLQLLASTASNSVGVALQGLDPEADPLVDSLGSQVTEGVWLTPGDSRGVMLGESLAGKLKVRVGSKVVLMSGGSDGDVISQLGKVRGFFKSGIVELDSFLVVADEALARRFLVAEGADPASEPITRLAVFLDDPRELEFWKTHLKSLDLPSIAQVLDWEEMMPQLVAFIMLDDVGNYIWLIFIMVMAAFGILNTILMSVLERTREFGLLRALGLSRWSLVGLVFTETMLLALISMAAGWAVGGLGHWYFAVEGLDLSSMGQEALQTSGAMMDPILKSELSWGRIGALSGIVFCTTMVTGIYPALRAGTISPIAALQT